MPTRKIQQWNGYYNVFLVDHMPVPWGAFSRSIWVRFFLSFRIVDQDETHILFESIGGFRSVMVERSQIASMEKTMEEVYIPVNLAGWYHRPHAIKGM